MALTDPNGGVPYTFGARLPSAHASTIANQQPRALDGKTGAMMSVDQDYTVDFANGTTYLFTASLAASNRTITIPQASGAATYERFWFRFKGDCASKILYIKEATSGTTLAALAGTGGGSGDWTVCFANFAGTWRAISWSPIQGTGYSYLIEP